MQLCHPAVLCCAVIYTVLCCAALFCSVLRCSVLRCSVLTAVFTAVLVGGTFLYCAPDDARDGMEQFVDALAAAGLACVHQQPCPDE